MDKDLLDLKESQLPLEGTEKDRQEISKKIDDIFEDLKKDRDERKTAYTKRRDFFTGNHYQYSNINGLIRDSKQKKGHTNQVTNYAGKTVVKIAQSLSNNPPKLTGIPQDITNDIETIRTQSVQDFVDLTLDSKDNRFWKTTYRRASFNQSMLGDAAIRTYVVGDKIIIRTHDDMGSIMVGWNGTEPGGYDCVIAEMHLTAKAIKDLYGIIVNEKKMPEPQAAAKGGDWNNNQWSTKGNSSSSMTPPSGKNDLPTLTVREYDSKDYYALKIEGELVELAYKDDISYPKVSYWTFVHNIPNPPSNWSIADIDYLVDVQIELNDNDNRSSDYIRVGGVQRYVAYNMNDFDPESVKTSSGQVIFVNSPDGTAKFESLATNVNNFPADQYHARKLAEMYDMGLPKVNYGASGADSGRSKAMDYQSSIDLTIFKRDSWELAMQDIIEKIQIFGHFLHPELEFFNSENGEFVVRNFEFDWTDILPVSQADKIVNIANKYSMIGIPLVQAYKELGYRNPEAMVEQLKKELEDPNLMILRSKQWALSGGLLQAQNQAMTMQQTNASETPPPGNVNQPSTTLTSSENQSTSKPMASKGGTTSYSSMGGMIDKTRQNMAAGGK
ncbi:MAG: hypothetical protein NUV86_09580 [Candidatus Scalindua sp.]|nr:hypothetical protein [Candidatus Scalindua sp.]